MENKITKKYFIERLRDILAVEKIARDNYIKDIKIFKNMRLKTTIETIKIDEEKHISLLNSLIEMLEN